MEKGSRLRILRMRVAIRCDAGKVGGYWDYLTDADIAYCNRVSERYQYTALLEDALSADWKSARLA